MSDTVCLSPGQYGEFLGEMLQAPIEFWRPIMLTGVPGISKTERTKQVCSALGVNYWPCRPIQHDTVEYTGVPYVDTTDGKLRGTWVAFDELLPTDPNWCGMIHVDEVTQLDGNGQKIVASLIDKEGVAGRRIPKGARFVLSGNRQQDRAGSSRLLSIVESRCIQMEMVFSADDWMKWATAAGVHEIVRAFCDFAGDKFVPDFKASDTTHANPRTWHMVSDVLLARPNAPTDMNDPITTAVISGLVGKAAASLFLAFRQHYETLKTAIDDCLNNPQSINLDPTRRSESFAVAGALTERLRKANGSLTTKQLENVVVVANKMGNVLSALMFTNVCAFAPQSFARIIGTPTGQEWLTRHAEVMAQSRRTK